LTNDKTILKSSAYQKLSTAKPVINEEARRIMTALITKRNNPSVTIVNGIVSTIRIGLTITFKSERIMATKIAVRNESTETPGNR
jgi:hypothetical protein